jgi:hypothetical protein
MRRLLTIAVLLTLSASPASAQLNTVLSDLLNTILGERLQLSPGPHAGHFEPAAEVAVGTLAPALNALIADNIAAFPLSATAAGVIFDFSTGQPVPIIESQGPIFAEKATTLGRGRLNVGLTGTRLSLNRLSGIPLDELRFTFPHEDLGDPGLGDNPTEIDVIDVYMGLDVDATILALSATYGLLPNLDVGVALPFVSVSIGGTALAVVDSRTLSRLGVALHFFGGTPLDPILTTEEDYDDSVAGIGDVALRAKYHFPTSGDYDLGALLDVRLPTGSQDDYLGTGSVGVQLALLASATLGDFAPHANVGYNYRGSAVEAEGEEFDRSGIRFVVGFDQQLVPRVTFALGLLGTLDLGDDPLDALPGSVFITDSNQNSEGEVGEAEREVRLTNVPADRGSSTLDASIGARVAFSERFQALGNVLVPLNDNGLRSSIVPTIGVSLTF